MQAALDAFEADTYFDLVGKASTSCVAGIEDTEMADREEYLKSIVPSGIGSGTGTPPGTDGAARPPPASTERDHDDDEVEGDTRRAPIADVDLVVSRRKGRKMGVKGRIFEVYPHLWNVVSPTGA